MAAFNFPDPTVQQTVTNPITGSTYQWKEPPGKWVVTTKAPAGSNIIYEGDNPPIPRGDYKLWYSTDTLELYFWYEDVNGNGAWVPTAAPITMLEDLDNSVFELRQDLTAVNVAVRENENQIGRTIYFGDTAPTIYADTVYDGVVYPNELNYKFWYDDSRLELLILFRDADGDDSYVPVSIPLESLPESDISDEVLTYTIGQIQRTLDEIYLKNIEQDAALDDRVKKTGGDEMQGPFKVLSNPDIPSSRDARRIETYGVFSGSESTALRFGTTRDRIYVGHDDTSFNGLVKIDRIAEKNAGNSVKFENDINMGLHQIKNLGDATDDKDAVTYGQLKGELADLDVDLDGLDDTYLRLDVSNGPLTNDLTIDKSADGPSNGGLSGKETTLTLRGDRTGTTNSACTITFDNASSGYIGYLTYRSEKDGDTAFFKFNRDLELAGTLKTNSISTLSGDVTTFDKKLDFTSTNLNARFQKGFVVKKEGQSINGDNILTVYNDFVEYDGPTNSDKRIANRKWIWDNTVRDYNINSNWGLTAGQYINANTYGKVNNPGGSLLNKHSYEFLVSASGYGSFYVIGNDACVRNNLYVNSLAENANPKGNRVATVSTSRSMMSGMRQAILEATDFEDLKLRLLAKLEEMENSSEFSEDPTTFDIPDSNY